MNDDGEYTIQGELLSDENTYSIKVVRFDGHDKSSNIITRNEYGYKCLIVAMQQAYDYCNDVLNETRTIFKSNGVRDDIRLFDSSAFREAWYNACLHNLWIDGTPPAIYVFDDRLEIVSTGGIPSGMNYDEFFVNISKPVNRDLARIFTQLGLIEQTGHGVSVVVKKIRQGRFQIHG